LPTGTVNCSGLKLVETPLIEDVESVTVISAPPVLLTDIVDDPELLKVNVNEFGSAETVQLTATSA